MKIVEAFLFSEEYEKELFLLKCLLSYKHIDEWIVCENAYTHQGEYKGLVAKEIIAADARFEPFRNKITVIEGNRQFYKIDKSKFQDDLTFQCENWQRNLAYEYFIVKYQDDDWIVIHDVDEMLDFTSEARVNEFFDKLNSEKKGIINVPRLRYWFDFDNQYKVLYNSTLCKKSYLVSNPSVSLSFLKTKYNVFKEKGWYNIIAFEYSSCYGFNSIVRKLDTTAHTWYNKEDLKTALENNHKIMKPHNIKKHLRPNKYCFFETVVLNEKNSPLYVRENLQQLKTNIVDKNYEINRKINYPQFYSLSYFRIYVLDMIKRKKRKYEKKFSFFLRRLNFLLKGQNMF